MILVLNLTTRRCCAAVAALSRYSDVAAQGPLMLVGPSPGAVA
jgi:hypothetical protein